MRLDWEKYRPRIDVVGRSRWAAGRSCDPGWKSDCFVTDHDLWFIASGRGSVRLRTGWSNLRPGVCIWMQPPWRYDVVQNPNDPLCLNFIHFTLLDPEGQPMSSATALPPEYIEPPDPQLVEVITRRMVEMAWGFDPHGFKRIATDDPSASLAAQMLAALLMELDHASDPSAGGGRFSPRQRRTVEQAALRIMESPREVPTVPELARRAGYSVDHFIRIFRDATGLTPQKFVMQSRTRLAQRLLRETDLSVSEIAEAAGYRDIYFFSRQFKQFIGVSPSTYRNRAVEGEVLS